VCSLEASYEVLIELGSVASEEKCVKAIVTVRTYRRTKTDHNSSGELTIKKIRNL